MGSIKKTIRDLIGQKGTIRKVATDLGMDHANLLRCLKKDSNPGLNTVEKIVDYLGYEIKLIKRKGVNPKKTKPLRSRRRKGDL